MGSTLGPDFLDLLREADDSRAILLAAACILAKFAAVLARNKDEKPDRRLNPDEIARRLGISRKTLYKTRHRPEYASFIIERGGRGFQASERALEAYLDRTTPKAG